MLKIILFLIAFSLFLVSGNALFGLFENNPQFLIVETVEEGARLYTGTAPISVDNDENTVSWNPQTTDDFNGTLDGFEGIDLNFTVLDRCTGDANSIWTSSNNCLDVTGFDIQGAGGTGDDTWAVINGAIPWVDANVADNITITGDISGASGYTLDDAYDGGSVIQIDNTDLDLNLFNGTSIFYNWNYDAEDAHWTIIEIFDLFNGELGRREPELDFNINTVWANGKRLDFLDPSESTFGSLFFDENFFTISTSGSDDQLLIAVAQRDSNIHLLTASTPANYSSVIIYGELIITNDELGQAKPTTSSTMSSGSKSLIIDGNVIMLDGNLNVLQGSMNLAFDLNNNNAGSDANFFRAEADFFFGDGSGLTNLPNGVTGIVAGGNIDVNSLDGHVRIDFDDGNFLDSNHLWIGDQNFTGLVDVNGFSTGNALANEMDLTVGRIGAGFGGCIGIGDFQVCDTGNMGIVGDMNLDDMFIIRDMDGISNIAFMLITPGNLPRFIIPREGVDFATYNSRSMMVGGDIGQALDDDIILCSAQGYDKLSCDTDTFGADFGVQNNVQIRNSLFVDVNALVDGNLTASRINTADLNSPDATFTTKGIVSINPRFLDVNNGELNFDANTQDLLHFFDDSILETINVDVNSNGTDVNIFIGREGGGDLTLVFNDGYFIFDTTPPRTIALTAGSDTSPTLNYIFIPNSTQVLTVNTTGFPTDAEFAPIATVLVQSAASVVVDRAYKVHVWTDHADDEDTHQGHLFHVNFWIRSRPAGWQDGVAQTLTITSNAGRPDNVDFAVTSGNVLQLHPHAFPAFNTASDSNIFVVNDSGTAFTKADDLNALLTDSTGGSMSNRYFTLVVWGVVSEDAGDSKLMLNLPSGSYNKESDAIADVSGFANFNIPVDFRGTGFLISKLVLRHQPASGGTWTSIQETDLRGLFPSTAAAGGSGAVTTVFSDNLFKLFDETDSTKELQFELSGITTGNLRVLTVPDTNATILVDDGTVALTADWAAGAFDITLGAADSRFAFNIGAYLGLVSNVPTLTSSGAGGGAAIDVAQDIFLKIGGSTKLQVTTSDTTVSNDLSVSGDITKTGEYTFPSVDGDANDFMQTDGSGVISFVDGAHTIASHSDTSATGTELDTLTDDSMADALHRHSELSASDGTPDAAFSLDTTGQIMHTVASSAGTRERIFEEQVSDASRDFFSISNRTGTNSQFMPQLSGALESRSDQPALTFAGNTNQSNDTGTAPLVQFIARTYVNGEDYLQPASNFKNVTSRNLFAFGQTSDLDMMTMDKDGSVGIKGDLTIGASSTHVMFSNIGDAFFVGASTGWPFGEIYVKDNTSTMTLNSTGGKVQVTDFNTVGQTNNINASASGGRDDIIVVKAGVYFITSNLAVENSAGVAHKIDVSVWINNGATELTNIHAHKDLTAGTDVGPISLGGFADLAAADSIEVWIDTDRASNSNIIVEDITLTATQVGGT